MNKTVRICNAGADTHRWREVPGIHLADDEIYTDRHLDHEANKRPVVSALQLSLCALLSVLANYISSPASHRGQSERRLPCALQRAWTRTGEHLM